MSKDFDGWNELKKQLDALPRAPRFSERQVWWCSIGVNVGHEQDGKNEFYNRPVVVLRKFNRQLFLGLPLSTRGPGPYRHPFTFKNRTQYALLSHLRLYDARRFQSRLGELPEDTFDELKKVVRELLK